MTTLYGRQASLIIQGEDVETPIVRNVGPGGTPIVVGKASTPSTAALSITTVGTGAGDRSLRMQFKIEKSLTKNPNTLELSVYNMNASHRRAVQEAGLGLLLSAGYQGNEAIIYSGATRFVEHVNDGSDWVTKVECGDSVAELNTIVSGSFKPGMKFKDYAKFLVGEAGIAKGNLDEFNSELSGEYVNGVTAHGPATRELEWVLARAGLTFSIQDGKLQILKPDGWTSESAYVLNSKSGLIGSPEHAAKPKKGKPRVLKVKSFLLPQAAPGRRLVMDSREQKGVFVITKLTHTGDTHEGDWFSEMELLEVPA